MVEDSGPKDLRRPDSVEGESTLARPDIAVCVSLPHVLVALLVFACATSLPPPPSPIDSENSALVLALHGRAPVSIFRFQIDTVVFARLAETEEQSLISTDLYPSDYVAGGYFYAMDLPPGRYAAVAATRNVDREPHSVLHTEERIGPVTSRSRIEIDWDDDFLIYFEQDLIRRTLVNVGPGSVAFMGEFAFDTSVGSGRFDDTQSYYFRLLTSMWVLSDTARALLRTYVYSGSLREAVSNDRSFSSFLGAAGEGLTAAGWQIEARE